MYILIIILGLGGSFNEFFKFSFKDLSLEFIFVVLFLTVT
jgi:hypothetical protein